MSAVLMKAKCENCGKRIFMRELGKYALKVWMHYGYADQECVGLIAKYATPAHHEGNRP